MQLQLRRIGCQRLCLRVYKFKSGKIDRLPVPVLQRRHCTALLHNYKATISYDGTDYNGFQLQLGVRGRTIQGELEKALTLVTQNDRAELKVTASGRTDAGVHASGQVVNFFSGKGHCPSRLWHSMNRLLPPDIRVLDVQPVGPDFNARFSALSKEYRFQICTGPLHDPFLWRYSQHVYLPLDVEAMRQAAKCFLGSHDFTQFASTYPVGMNPRKTLTRFEVVEVRPGFLRLEVQGSGFLYRMVRHMVGALIEVGKGTMKEAQIEELLALGSKKFPGEKHRGWTVADAKGLFLHEVWY
ncbi:tRNA pseudouridine synthase A [Coccomyxa subellipsoidea C-169]|uniref:tRNA pseudouridine synthase n=1 Tax=Coccomyxa subellipsoidea (strain C-169) TaxID=574566 RepID=I0YS01_COCSC|nr:tRNA pseudouridine synthase A [Coccomyxa subellipsoidea C-169]EIE21170.1 tRNA pseudouridine synthase A [Coccomyxa subellipsoidea C-169]|eukprot:XP_005645714.1 tRNA pseudouridine synthase A [Coccomyxa subellipsoidea C-169]